MTTDTRANERRILAITCYGHALAHLSVLIFPALLVPLAAEFERDPVDALILSQGMYLLFGLGALPAGLLADRFGSRCMFRVFLFGTGFALIAVGLAPTPAAFAIAASALGFLASIYHPVGLSLISKTIPNRGWALGVNGVFGNIGLAAAPFVTGILTYMFGWRWAYFGVAIPTLAVACGSFLMHFDETARIERGLRPAEHSARMPLYFALLCCALVMGGFVYQGVSVTLPAAFEQQAPFLAGWMASVRGVPPSGIKTLSAALLTSFVYIVGIAGQLLGGRLADRRDLRVMYIAFHAVSLPGLVLMGFAADGWFLAATAVYIFFSLGMQPIENSLVAALTPDRLRSTAYGIKFALTFGVGSAAVAVVRAIARRAGLAAVFPWLGVAVVILIGAALALHRQSRAWHVRND